MREWFSSFFFFLIFSPLFRVETAADTTIVLTTLLSIIIVIREILHREIEFNLYLTRVIYVTRSIELHAYLNESYRTRHTYPRYFTTIWNNTVFSCSAAAQRAKFSPDFVKTFYDDHLNYTTFTLIYCPI